MNRKQQIICLMAGLLSIFTLLVLFRAGSGDATFQKPTASAPVTSAAKQRATNHEHELPANEASKSSSENANAQALASRFDEVRRLTTLGQSGVAEIIRRLASATSVGEKTLLCDALVQIGTDEAMQAFANAVLAEKDPTAREAMAAALDTTSTTAALELATSFLSITNDPAVLGAVNRTIGRMGNGDTVQFLTELYAENEAVAGQRQSVLTALGSLRNPQVVPALGTVVSQSPVAEISQAGALSLAKIGTADALTSLVEAFGQLPESRNVERETVIQQIAAVRNPESANLLASLASTSTDLLIQHAAGEALKLLPPASESSTPAAPVARPDLSGTSKIIP